MNTKYMVGVRDSNKKLIAMLFASSIKFAIKKYRKIYEDYNGYVTAEFVTTPEGYNITTVKHLKKGDYFVIVNSSYEKVGKTVYVKDYYDRSFEKYHCYKFHDVCSGRMLHGETLVTDQMTF